jgi:hypothetical protein
VSVRSNICKSMARRIAILLSLCFVPVRAQESLQVEVVRIQSSDQRPGEPLATIQQRVGEPLKSISVRVEDEKGRPVPNATVSWLVKGDLAGATPATGTSVTGPDGEVLIQGLVANRRPGSYDLDVSAVYMGKTPLAARNIKVVNTPRPRTKRNLLILAAAVGTGTALAVVLTRGSAPSAKISTVTATGPVGP